MSDTERSSPSGAENIFGKIVIPTIGIILALVRIGAYASPAESEPLQTPMYLAQDKGQRSPIFVDSSCSTQHLIKALKEAGLNEKYKTIVGGGASTQNWADKIGADAYAEDANDGVKKINVLLGH